MANTTKKTTTTQTKAELVDELNKAKNENTEMANMLKQMQEHIGVRKRAGGDSSKAVCVAEGLQGINAATSRSVPPERNNLLPCALIYIILTQ